MKNILKHEISIFQPFTTKNPLCFTDLESVLNVNFEENEYTNDVLKYRKTKNKDLKFKTIPFFVCGKVESTSLGGLKGGIDICIIDIDGKDNLKYTYNQMLEKLKGLPYVSIAIESIGGNGIWLPVLSNTAIKTNSEYKQVYKQISASIEAKTGLKTDNSCCNINRARFFGYAQKEKCYLDESKFTNEFEVNLDLKEIALDGVVLQTHATKNKWTIDFIERFEKPISKRKIETLLWMVEHEALDIETSFADWKSLAQSLWNCFKNDGLTYFLRFCKFYVLGDNLEKDLKLWDSVKENSTKYDLSKVYGLAKKYGLDVSNMV